VTTLLLVLWYATIAARLAAAYRLLHDRLIIRFPTVWVFLVYSVARSIALVTMQSNPRLYQRVWTYTIPLTLLLEAFAVAGVFWAVAEQYPRFRRPGSVILGCLAGIGASAAWLTHFVAVPPGWSAPWQAAQLLERNCVLIMTVVLAGTRFLLPRIPGIPIRPSAKRMADILTANAALELIVYAFFNATDARRPAVVQLVMLAGQLAGMTAMALFVTSASDRSGDIRPVTEHDEAAMIQAERWFDELAQAASHQGRSSASASPTADRVCVITKN
jgi:hypothetical protein